MEPFESVVSMLRPRLMARRKCFGVFDILERGSSYNGVVGDIVPVTVVVGVA